MKKIIPETLYDFRYASTPKFSPDGRFISYIVRRACDQDNNYKGDIYLYDTANKLTRRLTSAGDAMSCVWSDENTLLFSASRDAAIKEKQKNGDELTAYYEIDPMGGEAVLRFTIPVLGADIKPIGDKKYIVTGIKDIHRPDTANMSKEDAEKAMKDYLEPSYHVIDEWPFWFNGQDFIGGKRTVLFLFDETANTCEAITGTDTRVTDYDYKNGKILYTAQRMDLPLVRMNYPQLCLYDMATKETKTIIGPHVREFDVAVLLNDSEALIATTDGEICGLGTYANFRKLDLSTGKITKFADFDAAIGASTVGSDARLGGGQTIKLAGSKFYFTTTLEEHGNLMVLDTETGAIEKLTGDGSADSFDEQNGNIVVCGMYANDLPELYLNGEKITNTFDTSEYSVSVPEYFEFTNSDGECIHGYAMKPAGYEPGKKYPAILHIHGGPRTVFGSVFHHEMQVWANAGYFVMYCNPRGCDGRGSLFGDINGKYGTVDYNDIMEFTDEALRRYPDIDAERVGVGGGSYGGFMTNWIIGHTNRFKAAVSQRSIANWVSFEHTTDIGIYFTEYQQASTTRTNIEKIWWHSPLKYADKCVTPTLFIHSDKDQRCWMVEGLSMFTALKLNNCEAKLCLFKGETHELSRSGKPHNRIARMTEILKWYDEHLK